MEGAESYAMKKLRHIRRTNRTPDLPREKRRVASKIIPPKCAFIEAKIGHLETNDLGCWEASHRPARMLDEKDSRTVLERAANGTPQLIVFHKEKPLGKADLHPSEGCCVSSKLMNRIVLKNLTENLSKMAGLDDFRSEFPKINTGRGRMSATADRWVLACLFALVHHRVGAPMVPCLLKEQ
jgi:hypothetical protein